MSPLAVLAQQATPVATTIATTPSATVQNQSNWLIIAIYFGMVVSVGIIMMLLPILIAPSKPNPTKKMAYESGMPPLAWLTSDTPFATT